MSDHVPLQKSNAAAVDAIGYPNRCDCRLLLPIHINLHFPQAHYHILPQDLAATSMMLTGATAVGHYSANDFNDYASRMEWYDG
jgi:hypothetical protein